MKLSIEEYTREILKLTNISPENAKLFLSNNKRKIEAMYGEYINESEDNRDFSSVKKSRNDFEKTKFINLDGINTITAILSADCENAAFASSWIILPNLEKVLKKGILNEKYSEKEKFFCLCNHLVCPKIAEAIGIQSASYMLGQSNNSMCILSPCFCEKGEELVDGKQIKRARYGLSINKFREDIESIEKYFYEISDDNAVKDEAIQNYIKQTIFWFMIKNQDQADRNWGVIHGDSIGFAPNFDYDFCFDTCDRGPDERRVNMQNITEVIKYAKSFKWFNEWFKNVVEGVNIEICFSETNGLIPENYKEMYDKYRKHATSILSERIEFMKNINIPIEHDEM